jgi:predicted dehydrogenase
MEHLIRWGILGPGAIAGKFAAALPEAGGAELHAVGSRDLQRAEEFAAKHGAAHAYGTYNELAGDPGVDAVYIATPHVFHKKNTILCLRAGKHVLCEKPLAINAAEAREMRRAAGEESRVLMEAMWMRFVPATERVRELVASGAIGDLRRVTADFSFRADFDPAGRLFDPKLGGGALLDVGVYPLSLAHMLLGAPSEIYATARIGETGVDEESAVVLGYKNGEQAVLTASTRLEGPLEAYILGTGGSIKIHRPWWVSSRFSLTRPTGEVEDVDVPYQGNGFVHQIDAFMEAIRKGKPECEIMPVSGSVSVLETMDAIRREWQLVYPTEQTQQSKDRRSKR